MKQLTGIIITAIFLFGLGFFQPDVWSEGKSPLAGKLLANHKDKEKKEIREKEELLKMKEEELQKREDSLNKKEEKLKAWENRLKKRSRPHRSTQIVTPPAVISPLSPTPPGKSAKDTPVPPDSPQSGQPK